MSSLAELPEVIGFFSYSRDDDEAFQGTLSALRDAIQRELGAQLGRNRKNFRLWQDHKAIAPGTLWESEIKNAVAELGIFHSDNQAACRDQPILPVRVRIVPFAGKGVGSRRLGFSDVVYIRTVIG